LSLYIDQKYIALIAPRLDRFKRKNQKTYQFRCPICGDSEKSKIKARGYFFTKGNDMFFCCHNCGTSWTFGHFLKEMDEQLHSEYVFERYKDGENGHSNYKKPDLSEFNCHTPIFTIGNFIFDPENCTRILELPDGHMAKSYVAKRKIPEKFWNDLYFVKDFKKLVDQVEPDNEYYLKPDDSRLVIPFYNKEKRLIAFQGRSFKKTGMRYITIKVIKDAPKIFGLDRVDINKRVYVVEGPIDSLFLDNAIAVAGSNLDSEYLKFNDSIFIMDNERRNKEIIKKMEKIIEEGRTICIWPESVEEKDLNDMILAGYTPKEIQGIIDKNSHKGLDAEISLGEWRKC